MSERSGCSHCVLCRWDRVSPGCRAPGVARAVSVTAPVYVRVSEFPPCQPEQQRCFTKVGDKMPVDFKAQAPAS